VYNIAVLKNRKGLRKKNNWSLKFKLKNNKPFFTKITKIKTNLNKFNSSKFTFVDIFCY
jgi:hypothetical protein